MSDASTATESWATAYDRDGFVVHAAALVPADVLAAAGIAMDAVVAGEYAEAPRAGFERRDPPTPDGLVKIDQAHIVDPALHAVASYPALGRFAASVLGAQRVQLWASQLLLKPPGGVATAAVGWHQDLQYWQGWWSGETFTIWLALADVEEDMGPLTYVRGSHRWGLQDGGNFFDHDLAAIQGRVGGGEWHEEAAVLDAGGVSLHHHLTLHGSRPNTSPRARRGIALHLRTERAEPLAAAASVYGADWLDDPAVSPVLWPS